MVTSDDFRRDASGSHPRHFLSVSFGATQLTTPRRADFILRSNSLEE